MRVLLSAVAVLSLVSPVYAQLAVPTVDTGLTYGHVHLNVSDMELHKRLWVEHFNGVVVEKGPLTAIRLPNFLVALSGREPTGGSRGSVMDHFGFLGKMAGGWLYGGFRVHRCRGVAECVCHYARRSESRASRRSGSAG